jgi:hypothetical protein
MRLNNSNRPIGASLVALAVTCSPACAADAPSGQLTNDVAMIILERLDKQTELHHSMMRSDLCEAAVRRHDHEGNFLETIIFSDAKVTGLVKGWACIKPDGTKIESKSLRKSR